MASDAIIVQDLEGRISFWNQAAERMYGWSREEAQGKLIHKLLTTVYPSTRAEVIEALAEHGHWEGELAQMRRNGAEIFVSSRWAAQKDSDGRAVAILQINTNITQRKRTEAELEEYRKHLEKMVEQRTAELARSNEALVNFAYVASHDLQEPLRVVLGYLQLLELKLHAEIDPETKQFIDCAVGGAKHMQQLISDLLAYSRAGNAGKAFDPVNMESVLEKVREILQHAIREAGALVTHDPLPTVLADETQMVQLMQNLIANGVKFRSDRPPRIHVSAKSDGGRTVFCVQDNGIGIDKKFWEKIFVIFQRLHTRTQYAGTGIGLAICRKIVERHGGRIWVESEAGQGSAFYFTI